MIVDWARVRELHDEIGAEDFDDIAEMFLDEVAEAIENLAAAETAQNMEADLHFIKGSALNIGFASLATIAAEWEAKVRDNEANSVPVELVVKAHSDCVGEFTANRSEHLSAA